MSDLQIQIAKAASRRSPTWKNFGMSWRDFVTRLRQVTRTGESMAEYKKMQKAMRDARKDIGGFVGGYLEGGKRRKGAVKFRDLLTLDLDYAPSLTELKTKLAALGFALVAYPTHSSTHEHPRYRVVAPFSRHVKSEEYEPIARKIAEHIGIDYMDATTYEPERLMYWPSVPQDADGAVYVQEGEAINADAVLAEYEDWHDASAWPTGKRETVTHERTLKKLGDPREKPGAIGAFCRAYTVREAMEKFIPGVYTPVLGDENRFTYAKGSTTGGAILYDGDLFLCSHHDTDPAGGGHEVNAFDLVRLHKFGELDSEDELTPINKRPSYQKMVSLTWADEKVRKEADAANLALMKDDLLAQGWDADEVNKLDTTWRTQLETNSKTGAYLPSMRNVLLILEKDATVAGMVGRDEFADRLTVRHALPWDVEAKGRAWSDADDAQLRIWFDRNYGINRVKQFIDDGMLAMAEKFKFHPVRNYLNSIEWDGLPRVETFLVEFLGAEDTPLTRESMKVWVKGAVARIFVPGIKFDLTLSLTGPQGIGKTMILERLGGDWFNATVTTVKNKDALVQLLGSWIIELGEGQAVTKSDNDELKAYLTRTVDKFRPPYGKRVVEYQRQCVFAITENDDIFLKDRTGGRRFLIVRCKGIQDMEERRKKLAELTPEFIAQLWAEAKVMWETDRSLLLPEYVQEDAKRIQEESTEGKEKAAIVQNFLDTPRPPQWEDMPLSERISFVKGRWKEEDRAAGIIDDTSNYVLPQKTCAMEILCELFGMDFGRVRNIDTREINTIMQHMPGWKLHNSKSGMLRFKLYGPQRAYIRESTIDEQLNGFLVSTEASSWRQHSVNMKGKNVNDSEKN